MTPTPRFGLGFRSQHFAELSANPRAVDWLELLSDAYLGVGGPRRAQLERLRADFSLALHGVSLGVANDTAPEPAYVAALRELADLVEPLFVSDHLCWTGLSRQHSHDLLPVALTANALALVAERVERVQEALGRRLLLENASAYVKFRADEMGEGDFLAALCRRTGCGVLLDVNNLFVNAANLAVDPARTLAALRPEHVAYLHVAGHTALPDVHIDTHAAEVPGGVWALLADVVRRFPHAHVILERDDAIPPLADLVRELDQARAIWGEANGCGRAASLPAPVPACSVARPAPRPARSRSRSADGAAPWRALAADFWRRCVARPPGVGHADAGDLLDLSLPVPAARGLRVYSDALAGMAERALAANFPTLARVLSPRDFSALCAAFARAHPSTSHDYLRFGAPLARFLEGFELADGYAIERSVFADIARLEQAQLEVQEAPDAATRIGADTLAAIPAWEWGGATFELAPACRALVTEHDVLPALRSVAAGASPARPARMRSGVLVTRIGVAPHVDPIEPAGAEVLRALADGHRFADACARAGGEDAAGPGARALALACARGGVCALRLVHSGASPIGA